MIVGKLKESYLGGRKGIRKGIRKIRKVLDALFCHLCDCFALLAREEYEFVVQTN